MKPQAHVPEEGHAKGSDRTSTGPLSLAELSAILTGLHAQEPGCILAAFGDLKARLVLRAEPAGVWPQEALDELCGQACEAFDLAWIASDTPVVAPIIALAPGQTRLFLKIGASPVGDHPAGDSDDALLIVCDSLPTARRVEGLLAEKLRGVGASVNQNQGDPCAR
ncbi:hypothetical protein KMP13_17755 [Epibacterium ulvae]|uniref:hypothetical protein n=1 Tax=Epibacterium ulvae TaxID=1156985 RepID=UPI001BFC7E3D|nr:hypothetical protein [Epibacterium ulvae]MBT8155674.1 hypothetical protein [Epibacterium ulvae]